ncbi:Chloramphenicol acetyltransferase (plasmid) [Citrobacter freundii]|nr:Chloramphenicol acetyltransferase [Citrobacter freundii]CAH6299033.1 Chloramphenicol acetyltransferase [Citrobacter freundii]
MTNYFDSPFKGKLLSEQVKNESMKNLGAAIE